MKCSSLEDLNVHMITHITAAPFPPSDNEKKPIESDNTQTNVSEFKQVSLEENETQTNGIDFTLVSLDDGTGQIGSISFVCTDCGKVFHSNSHLLKHSELCQINVLQKDNHFQMMESEKGSQQPSLEDIDLNKEITDIKSKSLSFDRYTLQIRNNLERMKDKTSLEQTYLEGGNNQIESTHSNEKYFTCDVCECKFSSRISLAAHSHMHIDEIPFLDNEYDKGFQQQEGQEAYLPDNSHNEQDENRLTETPLDNTFMHTDDIQTGGVSFTTLKQDKQDSNLCSTNDHREASLSQNNVSSLQDNSFTSLKDKSLTLLKDVTLSRKNSVSLSEEPKKISSEESGANTEGLKQAALRENNVNSLEDNIDTLLKKNHVMSLKDSCDTSLKGSMVSSLKGNSYMSLENSMVISLKDNNVTTLKDNVITSSEDSNVHKTSHKQATLRENSVNSFEDSNITLLQNSSVHVLKRTSPRNNIVESMKDNSITSLEEDSGQKEGPNQILLTDNSLASLKNSSVPVEEKQFDCTVCGKWFSRKFNLQKHSRIHTGEKPFSCEKCERKFSDKSNLMKHSSKHDNFGEKKPTKQVGDNCAVSQLENNPTSLEDKSVPIRTSLEYNATNVQGKPFGCIFCGKAFRYKFNLAKHNRIHTGEKPFIVINASVNLVTRVILSATELNTHRRTLLFAIHVGKSSRENFPLKDIVEYMRREHFCL